MIPFTVVITVFLLLALVGIYGCAQKDSAVGSSLVPNLGDTDPQDLDLTPLASNLFLAKTANGINPYLYLGQAENYRVDLMLSFIFCFIFCSQL